MIFIPCREGISHNPAEFADMDDIVTGAKILDTVLRKLSLESTKLNQVECGVIFDVDIIQLALC